MRDRRIGFGIATLLAIACVLALAAPALGIPDIYTPQWGNGNNGGFWRGTHGWAMYNGALMASRHGVTWMNYDLAVDASAWPDTKFADNIDHNYDRWGDYPSWYNSSWHQPFGNPQYKVQQYYNAAVAALRRGDTNAASEDIGLMSHYFADVHEPMHTEESAGETRAVHTNYEARVDSELSSTDSHTGWIHDDGYQHISNPTALTVSEAIDSHSHYSTLVSNYANHGFNSTVENITADQLNRTVNGLSDLVVSIQDDADQVSASITTVDPSSATTEQPVLFSGYGSDPRHSIVQWQWRSSVNGVLSNSSAFSTTGLSLGIHTIYFKVRCSHGKWSDEVSTPYVVGATNTIPRPVYRFYNFKKGVHFFTASETERRNVVARLSSTYRLEGVSYAIDASGTINSTPLYRFLNYRRGVHFYTASVVERDDVIRRLWRTYRYEGPAWKVSDAGQPVFRFFNIKNGVHFYTASVAERDDVRRRLSRSFRYEGVAYYYVPPW